MSLTEDYTFQLGDDGVVLNTEVGLPFVDIRRVIGLDNAPYRETQRDHEGTDGGFMDAEFEKGRPVSLEGFIYCDSTSIEPYLDDLKENFAPSTTLIPFYLKPNGRDERLLFVKPLGCRYDWEENLRLGIIPVQFNLFAEDPRLYEATVQTFQLTQGAVAVTGFGFPFGFPLGFGADIVSGVQNLIVTGNRPTPALMIITGPVTTPEIINDSLGKSLKFNITLTAGQTLEVDLQYHTVLLDGSANRRGTLSQPDWFFLQKGDNFLRYRADSAIGSSTVTITYRNAWR